MGVERARVVEVHAPSSPTGRVGTGYLITDRLVLTCDRVVGRRGRTDVRPAETAAWLAASVTWSGGGAAVLEVDDPSQLFVSADRIGWGEVTGARPVAVTAMGFPPSPDRPDRFRDPIPFVGRVQAAQGALAVACDGEPPDGTTGAALFAGAHLVGVLAGMRAVPASVLAADERFVELVGGLSVTEVSAPAIAFPILGR